MPIGSVSSPPSWRSRWLSLAHPNMLGVVTQAQDANLSTGPVSAGTTVYDGDRLSTQAHSALSFHNGTAMRYLARESRMTLRGLADQPKGTQAGLSAGTLVFSGAQASAMADDARIRAVADAPPSGKLPSSVRRRSASTRAKAR